MSGFEPSSAAVGKELHESIQASDELTVVIEQPSFFFCLKQTPIWCRRLTSRFAAKSGRPSRVHFGITVDESSGFSRQALANANRAVSTSRMTRAA
ncbi:hypothetical protein PCANC_12926 [Puccinia coronata f. sp. avenae]|uniref:Uncharacterized protein n=1 Tax=Puccinia coronata f. sp. avenae TaxID=200324 RepID=A0A2N5RUN9_9BASI|nr:hypothetical protein PCASD_25280 [Puccinia coronata f. sp. avenae]PLW10910.1 hypothetical protein PCANC_19128 [Puccinia coronata f. sp. avenae]PLW28351.1 hypothetical protein PCASD_17463 [Puccinia coronata f. sp. avenae]PLW39201.1 hypothetical protein PCANC_12926 [Puccinia coronata f. sp. avenae]